MRDNPDPMEPNQNLDQAKPLNLPATRQVSIFPVGDHDCYKIQLPVPGQVKVSATNVKGIGLNASFFNILPKGKLECIKERLTLPCNVELPAGQQCLLVINDDFNDQACYEPFTLSVTAVSKDGARIKTGLTGLEKLITMPDCKGMPGSKARNLLAEKGLIVTVIGDESSAVEQQIPPAGRIVEVKDRVAIGCPKAAPLVIVPRLIGLDVNRAKALLTRLHLRLISPGRNGKIINQIPPPNMRIRLGSPVRLMLAPPRPTLPVPSPRPPVVPATPQPPTLVKVVDVRGKTEVDARAALGAVGLKVVITPGVADGSEAAGLLSGVPDFEIKLAAMLAAQANRSGKNPLSPLVATQSVNPGKMVNPGTTVELKLAKAKPVPTPIPPKPTPPPTRPKQHLIHVPPVLGKLKVVAAGILRRQGFVVRFKGKTVGRVKSQVPSGGKAVARGTVVTLTIGR